MSLLIVSCSLNPSSKSRTLARVLKNHFSHEEYACHFEDLADYSLPHCDGEESYNHPDVKRLQEVVDAAEAVILALPIYTYGASATAKNFIELVGKGLEQKIVGFVCAAGGQKSYMSIMGLANSLMLDFRCLIVPKFVYVDQNTFSNAGELECPEIRERLHELLTTIVRLKEAWKACR